MRRVTLLLSCFVLLAGVPAAAKNDKNNGNHAKANGNKNRGKKNNADTGDMKRRTERNQVDDYDYGIPRRTEGHRPHDRNGDGLVTRNEWPGNDASFRQLDRDGDGVISRYDRGLNADARSTTTHRSRTDRFSGLDRNRDGRLTQSEWRMSGRSFSDYDHDRNGVITRDEFPF